MVKFFHEITKIFSSNLFKNYLFCWNQNFVTVAIFYGSICTWEPSDFIKARDKCCRFAAICGQESPDRIRISGIDKRGVIGAVKRSNFLMNRRKIVRVHVLKNLDAEPDEDPFVVMANQKPSIKQRHFTI